MGIEQCWLLSMSECTLSSYLQPLCRVSFSHNPEFAGSCVASLTACMSQEVHTLSNTSALRLGLVPHCSHKRC